MGAQGLALMSVLKLGAGWSCAVGTGGLGARGQGQGMWGGVWGGGAAAVVAMSVMQLSAGCSGGGSSCMAAGPRPACPTSLPARPPAPPAGLVVARQPDGSWSPPCAAMCYGVGWGLQLGGELTDVLLVLRTREAVKAFCGNLHLGVGGAASVAVGFLGRQAEAMLHLGDGGSATACGYSCSKGAYIGASLEGSVMRIRWVVVVVVVCVWYLWGGAAGSCWMGGTRPGGQAGAASLALPRVAQPTRSAA